MHVIVNPAAAGGRLGREWPTIADRLAAAGINLEVCQTAAPGHASALAAALAESGSRRIAVAGGDGTLCEVADGLVGSAAGCEVAVLPLGTGNDAARTLGIPLDPIDAARLARAGTIRRVDVLRVGDRHVLNAIGVGLTGDINRRAARIKWIRGIAVYLATAAVSLVRFRAPRVRVVCDRVAHDTTMTILAVHNGPTTGGGFALTPNAVPDDGLLDAVVVPDVPLRGRVQRLVGALRGTLHAMEGSVTFQTPVLELHHDEPLPVHFDGNQGRLEGPVCAVTVLT